MYFKLRSLYFSFSGLSALYVKVDGGRGSKKGQRQVKCWRVLPLSKPGLFVGDMPLAIAFLSEPPQDFLKKHKKTSAASLSF